MAHEGIQLAIGWIVPLFIVVSAIFLIGHALGLLLFHLLHKEDVRRLEETSSGNRAGSDPVNVSWGRFGFWDLRHEMADAIISPAASRTRRMIGRLFMQPASILGSLLLLMGSLTIVAMFAVGFVG